MSDVPFCRPTPHIQLVMLPRKHNDRSSDGVCASMAFVEPADNLTIVRALAEGRRGWLWRSLRSRSRKCTLDPASDQVS
jgi:hypothetical protein